MKRLIAISTLAMLAFGGYVGFVTNYTNTATAHEYVIPKLEMPKKSNLDIDINLNKNVVAVKGNDPEQNINVNIEKKDSIVYLTSVVEKRVEVPKYIRVREMPSMKENKTSCMDVLKIIREDKSEPQLELPMRSLSYNGVIPRGI